MNDGTYEAKMKRIPVIVTSLLLGVLSLWALQTKMFVKVDRAVVYAEPSENSYKIDTVRRGTVLTVFDKGIDKADWLYVTFESRRWKGKVTGFIKVDLVITEEEMLREDQRRLEEEEAQKRRAEEAAGEGEEKRTEARAEAEMKAEPQDELPDLKAVFAKTKPEEKEAKEKPQLVPEKKEPAPVKEEMTEKPEPAPIKEEPSPELKEEVKEQPVVEKSEQAPAPEL